MCHNRRVARVPRGVGCFSQELLQALSAHKRANWRVALGGAAGKQGPVGGEPVGQEVSEEALGVAGAHRLGDVTGQPVT